MAVVEIVEAMSTGELLALLAAARTMRAEADDQPIIEPDMRVAVRDLNSAIGKLERALRIEEPE